MKTDFKFSKNVLQKNHEYGEKSGPKTDPCGTPYLTQDLYNIFFIYINKVS